MDPNVPPGRFPRLDLRRHVQLRLDPIDPLRAFPNALILFHPWAIVPGLTAGAERQSDIHDGIFNLLR
ncbi:MAG: hypothetical protein Q8Q80_07880 [Methyloversatilis sp.]|uniref:hypothetical protein n=1 Tax=Methyloversatilis sp. TaxID=2569862 RepID=UPI0027365979|nr:hypothetical protein [Methyloversatilis sp.]MDP3872567.1 hypothetical protein [Methyloversatilis sp.]